MSGRRWTRASKLYLAASIVLAAFAGARLHHYSSRDAAAGSGSGSLVPVVVASQPVARGRALEPSQLRVIRLPGPYAPPGAFSKVEQAAGRVVLADLATGEAVTDTRLARVRAGPVASLVPPGLRAFAVPTALPPGLVAPGDRVDILATFGSGQPRTERIVDAVEVLLVLRGTGAEVRSGMAGPAVEAALGTHSTNTLVVLVAPEQQERLAFARAFASLEVVVAPPDNSKAVGAM